jgi:predicted nucleic acid-binding protein
MKIVVDTNVVFSAILNSQSWIGQIILQSDKAIKFYSPRYLQIEIQNHFQKIK